MPRFYNETATVWPAQVESHVGLLASLPVLPTIQFLTGFLAKGQMSLEAFPCSVNPSTGTLAKQKIVPLFKTANAGMKRNMKDALSVENLYV